MFKVSYLILNVTLFNITYYNLIFLIRITICDVFSTQMTQTK